MVSNCPVTQKGLSQVVQLIKAEQMATGKKLHQVEFNPFKWEIDSGFLNRCIADAAADDVNDEQ